MLLFLSQGSSILWSCAPRWQQGQGLQLLCIALMNQEEHIFLPEGNLPIIGCFAVDFWLINTELQKEMSIFHLPLANSSVFQNQVNTREKLFLPPTLFPQLLTKYFYITVTIQGLTNSSRLYKKKNKNHIHICRSISLHFSSNQYKIPLLNYSFCSQITIFPLL